MATKLSIFSSDNTETACVNLATFYRDMISYIKISLYTSIVFKCAYKCQSKVASFEMKGREDRRHTSGKNCGKDRRVRAMDHSKSEIVVKILLMKDQTDRTGSAEMPKPLTIPS